MLWRAWRKMLVLAAVSVASGAACADAADPPPPALTTTSVNADGEVVLPDNPIADLPEGWPVTLPPPLDAALADSSTAHADDIEQGTPLPGASTTTAVAATGPGSAEGEWWALFLSTKSDVDAVVADYKATLAIDSVPIAAERATTDPNDGHAVVLELDVSPAVTARFRTIGEGVGILFSPTAPS